MKQSSNTKQDKEFSRCAVPMTERKSFCSLTIVWTGFVFVITSMMAGGGLAAGLNMRDIIIATIVGNIFLSIIAMIVSYIASKTGLTFALLTRYSFGLKGTRLASLFVPIVNIGWYTIQSAAYGHFIAQVFGWGPVGESICMFVSAIIMGIFAISGIRAITILGYVAIPAIVYLSLFTALKSTIVAGGWDALFLYIPKDSIDISTGITIVIGTWILSVSTCIADIMRYAKSPKEAILSTGIGLLGGNILMIMCGAIAAIAVKDSDLTVILLHFGLVIPALILMTTNIFTTNAANLYSTSLNLANVFKMERAKMLWVILIISAFATLIRPYKIEPLFTFLGGLGTVVPPLSGIILADYFIIRKGQYKVEAHEALSNWNIAPWIVWALSIGITYNVNMGLPSLNGLILGFVLYIIISKIFPSNRGGQHENT